MSLYFSPEEHALLEESAKAFGIPPKVLSGAIELELGYQAKGRRHGLFTQLREIVASSTPNRDSDEDEL